MSLCAIFGAKRRSPFSPLRIDFVKLYQENLTPQRNKGVIPASDPEPMQKNGPKSDPHTVAWVEISLSHLFASLSLSGSNSMKVFTLRGDLVDKPWS